MGLEGLKFRRKTFKFASKKKYNDFFNNALIEGPVQFIRVSKAEFDEKMHIALSWMFLAKIISWLFLGIAVIGMLASATWIFGAAVVGLSFLSRFASKRSESKLEALALVKSFCIGIYEMNNYENLEEVRQQLIEEKK